MGSECTHVDQIRQVSAGTPEGCEECLATHGRWVHLPGWCYVDEVLLEQGVGR